MAVGVAEAERTERRFAAAIVIMICLEAGNRRRRVQREHGRICRPVLYDGVILGNIEEGDVRALIIPVQKLKARRRRSRQRVIFADLQRLAVGVDAHLATRHRDSDRRGRHVCTAQRLRQRDVACHVLAVSLDRIQTHNQSDDVSPGFETRGLLQLAVVELAPDGFYARAGVAGRTTDHEVWTHCCDTLRRRRRRDGDRRLDCINSLRLGCQQGQYRQTPNHKKPCFRNGSYYSTLLRCYKRCLHYYSFF